MKIECKRDIITDLSPDDVIYDRFDKETPKLAYWMKKCGYQGLERGCFPDEPLQVLNPGFTTFRPFVPLGVIKWQNIYNGDNWVAAVFQDKYYPYSKMSIYFYYWVTIGSIGFMTQMGIGTAQEKYQVIVAFSSHAMLRYKVRAHLDVSGFDLITYLVGSTYMNIPRIYERNGRETFEMICKEGVFRAPIKKGNVLVMKTFISWGELNKHDFREADELWNLYQKLFSE